MFWLATERRVDDPLAVGGVDTPRNTCLLSRTAPLSTPITDAGAFCLLPQTTRPVLCSPTGPWRACSFCDGRIRNGYVGSTCNDRNAHGSRKYRSRRSRQSVDERCRRGLGYCSRRPAFVVLRTAATPGTSDPLRTTGMRRPGENLFTVDDFCSRGRRCDEIGNASGDWRAQRNRRFRSGLDRYPQYRMRPLAPVRASVSVIHRGDRPSMQCWTTRKGSPAREHVQHVTVR